MCAGAKYALCDAIIKFILIAFACQVIVGATQQMDGKFEIGESSRNVVQGISHVKSSHGFESEEHRLS